MQDMAREFGCVISGHCQSTISVDSVYDHFDVPSYPKTSVMGIAHFVHFPSPLIQEGALKPEVHKVMNRQMSKVCVAYAEYMPNLTSYRFNSHSIVIISIPPIFKSLARIIRIKIIRHGIVHRSVLESNIVNMPIRMYYAYAQHTMMSS